MAEIINLRQARKARARNDAEAQAAANRIRFGRTKTQREADRKAISLLDKRLDGARREPD